MRRASDMFGVGFDDESKTAKRLQGRIFFAPKKPERALAYGKLLAVSERVDEQVMRAA